MATNQYPWDSFVATTIAVIMPEIPNPKHSAVPLFLTPHEASQPPSPLVFQAYCSGELVAYYGTVSYQGGLSAQGCLLAEPSTGEFYQADSNDAYFTFGPGGWALACLFDLPLVLDTPAGLTFCSTNSEWPNALNFNSVSLDNNYLQQNGTAVPMELQSIGPSTAEDGCSWMGRNNLQFQLIPSLSLNGHSFDNCPRANLSGATLTGCSFSGSAAGNSFAQATLTNCTFDRCNLTGADFTGANLNGCTFTNCTFTAVTLRGVVITEGITVSGGDLTSTVCDSPLNMDQSVVNTFENCTLDLGLFRSNWSSLNLVGSSFGELPPILSSPTNMLNCSYANLTGFDLSGLTIQMANFTGATLAGVSFTNSDLSFSNFTQAVLGSPSSVSADLSYTNLFECSFDQAVLDSCNLSFTALWGAAASITESSMIGTNFSNAFLYQMNFSTVSDLAGVNFTGALLVAASFEGIHFNASGGANVSFAGAALQGASFVNCTLSNVDLTNSAIVVTLPEDASVNIVSESTGLPPTAIYTQATQLTSEQTGSTTICDFGGQGPCLGSTLYTPREPLQCPATQWPVSQSALPAWTARKAM